MTDDEIMALAIHNVTGAREMQADLIDFARAILAAQLAAPASSEWKRCPHCGTHEIEIERTCHNSVCTGYARAESVYRGWQQGEGE